MSGNFEYHFSLGQILTDYNFCGYHKQTSTYTCLMFCCLYLPDFVMEYSLFMDMFFLKQWADCNDSCSWSSFSQDNYTSNSDEDGLLDLLFGQDFPDFGSVSPPRSESTSSDSDMTTSPHTCTMDDVELSEILSSTSASPGLPQNSEDFTIDLGKYNIF